MKGTPDVFHELDKVIVNIIDYPYCEIAINEEYKRRIGRVCGHFRVSPPACIVCILCC